MTLTTATPAPVPATTVEAGAASGTPVDLAAALAAVAALDLDPHLAAIEAARRLPGEVADALTAAGLFRLYTPRELGGAELDPWSLCQVVEAAAARDASVAWCLWNGNNGFAAGLLDESGAAGVFGPPDAVVANSARIGGQATTVEGGYRLSGRWDLVSGCDIATRLLLFALVVDQGEPHPMAFAVPRSQVQIIDTWHVLGLRGTGSNTVVVDDAFIPATAAAFPFGPSRIDRTLFRIPPFTSAACGGAAVCLGIARAAIATLTDLAATKVSIGGPEPILTHGPVLAALAEADVRLAAARSALAEALTALTTTVATTGEATLTERGRVRAAMTLAAQTARDVTLTMFTLGSSTVIATGHPLERQLRDVLVAAQHVMLQPLWYEQAGRTLVGGEPTLPVL